MHAHSATTHNTQCTATLCVLRLKNKLGGLRVLKVLDITHNQVVVLLPPLGATWLKSFEVGDQQDCLWSPPMDVVALGTHPSSTSSSSCCTASSHASA